VEPLYRLIELLLRRPLHSAFRWKIEGLDRLPKSGPVLLASNHLSYLDPLCLAYVAHSAGRRARYLAKAELWRTRPGAWAMNTLKHIPIERGTSDAGGALGMSADALGEGRFLVVFPEGTLSKDFDPMAGRTGVARLAKAAGVPVTPVGLWGTHRLLSAGHRHFKLGVAITVVIGEPVAIGPGDNAREATDRIMGEICSQVARARAIYPQAPTSEADRWWDVSPKSARLRSCRGKVAQEMLDRQAEAG
jgi:1-acyl-sn-glycerol-3-phosphate acyltransferase